jgi:glycosyltransferase involved in cell wall biosynthesis
MDVAVAPYPALDGFYFSPIKILEYMAAGLPVVASAIGQVKALVRHGDTGWLFEPGDAAGLAEALLHLHDEPRLRTRLGYTARTYVAGQCTWQRVLDRVLRLPGVSLERAEAAVS